MIGWEQRVLETLQTLDSHYIYIIYRIDRLLQRHLPLLVAGDGEGV